MKEQKRFISWLSDYGFKVTFADESDTLFLRKALQALIQSEHAITAVEFSRNEFLGITQEARGGVFDLYRWEKSYLYCWTRRCRLMSEAN